MRISSPLAPIRVLSDLASNNDEILFGRFCRSASIHKNVDLNQRPNPYSLRRWRLSKEAVAHRGMGASSRRAEARRFHLLKKVVSGQLPVRDFSSHPFAKIADAWGTHSVAIRAEKADPSEAKASS